MPKSREFTAKALDDELARRRKNKTRETKVGQKSWVLRKLTQADVATIKDGGSVTVTGKNAGAVTVTLKAAA